MNIFITGASSGIGEYLAYAYSGQNIKLGLAARRTDKLDEVAEKCRKTSSKVFTYKMDVNDRRQSKSIIQQFISDAGGLNIVIANAGVANHDHLKSGDAEVINTILHTNILGVTNTILPAIPYMIDKNKGKIVIISSIASFSNLIHHGGYSASKIAVKTLANSWRKTLKKYNIQISTIMPGFIESEMTADRDVKMPFLMDTDTAAKKIKHAVDSGKSNYIFPWQWRFLIPVMKWKF
tara:strand:+ start:18 stop:725 length:708 start_codon:yes stop_codon:yes gene_type:complete